MTEVKIFRDKGADIVKGELIGHTDYAELGEDIVCASISSVLFMALNGIENVLKVDFGYETDDGYAMFVLPEDLDDNKKKEINILLDSMYLFFKSIEEQYPDNVKITELEV
ncbi:MAG: ribosomal-processing cysteine protease Prp [Clostridia bacterium]|nr:ribosomal-processing cysteine protease Prp [Clostridia bacterium]